MPASSTAWRSSTAHLGQCVEDDGTGRQRLTVTLPDRAALDVLAQSLARLLAVGGKM